MPILLLFIGKNFSFFFDKVLKKFKFLDNSGVA